MLPGKRASKFMPTDVDRGNATGDVRGAKRGGLTDHIAGVHMIPNVGREAMVPGEVVRRQPRAPKKLDPMEAARLARMAEMKAIPQGRVVHKKKDDKKHRERSPRRGRGRSREPSKERRERSCSSSDADQQRETTEEEKAREAQLTRQDEADRKRQEQLDEAAKERFEQEQKKLKELEDIRQKTQDQQAQRQSKLKGLFALNEDDIDAEEDTAAKKAKIAKEKARVEKKAADLAKSFPSQEKERVSYTNPQTMVPSSSSSMMDEGMVGNLTAADLDGSQHDHKFSKVWKDWDAQKKSDPGEVARQFMKIAAVKRRGYAPNGDRNPAGQRERSRSRSRGRFNEGRHTDGGRRR